MTAVQGAESGAVHRLTARRSRSCCSISWSLGFGGTNANLPPLQPASLRGLFKKFSAFLCGQFSYLFFFLLHSGSTFTGSVLDLSKEGKYLLSQKL